MHRIHLLGAGDWIGRFLAAAVLAVGAMIALAATVSAQTPPEEPNPPIENIGSSDPNEENQNQNLDPGNGGSGDGGSGSGSGSGDGGSSDGGSGGGSGSGDGGSSDGGSGSGGGSDNGGSGDGGSGSGGGSGDGGSGDGGSGSSGDDVDPEEARIAACASRYGGYQAGWAEQHCRYPNLVCILLIK